jgi:hypothetical protein
MPARSGARWWPRIIVLAACVLTAVACSSAPPARDAARRADAPPDRGCPAPAPPAVRRAIQTATANILTAFAAGAAGRAHPARELIPRTGGRPPLLGTS